MGLFQNIVHASTGVFTATGSMLTPRSQHTATRLNDGTVLITGGINAQSQLSLNSAEIYNPATGTFTAVSNMNSARSGHTATLLSSGKVLIAGGRQTWYGAPSAKQEEIFDPATASFTYTGNLITARMYHTAILIPNGKVLLAGGSNSTPGMNSAEIFDPTTGTFSSTANMNSIKQILSMVVLNNGKVFVVGAQAGQSSSEVYDYTTGTFSPTVGTVSTGAWFAVGLSNGKVLVTGGQGGSASSLNSSEIYDPATNSFTSKSSMNSSRVNYSGVLLTDGNVLIVGGIDRISGKSANTAELFDYTTGTFSTIGNMNSSRSNSSIANLTNGNVLITEGQDDISVGISTTELFIKTTNGTCGAANLTTVATAPTSNLCTTGTASTTTGTGPWYWTCDGTNGGTPSICTAYLSSAPVDPTLAKSKLYMGTDDRFTASNSGISIYGGPGYDTVTISDGISGVTLDQNVERINFSGTASSYAFKQTGNKINIYNASGSTLIATAPVQGDSDGTLLGFRDGTASALLSGGVMTLGGKTVSSTTAGVLTPTLTHVP
jgi:hypothetical protein